MTRAGRVAPYLLLTVLVVACYAQVARFEFVSLDDFGYVRFNPHVNTGLTADNITWALTAVHRSNWHPLTWISHMIDAQLFGDWAGGAHLHNALLHLANTLLLMAVLVRLTGDKWRSFAVAALFAIHPTHVESVAWISERKDVLSTLFGLAALWCWTSYVRKRSRVAYATMCVLFAMSLMSKFMLVTLPFVMLLLDVWPLGRFGRRAAIEKLPLFALSIVGCALALWSQSSGAAMASLDRINMTDRLLLSIYGYGHYLWMTVWPVDLTVFYTPPKFWPMGEIVASFVVLIAITIAAIALRRRRPALLVGWLWFLGTLVPVIGLVTIGTHAYADRYTYVPAIGLYIAVVWLVPKLRLVAPPVIVVLAVLCFVQVGYWRSTLTLFNHVLDIEPDNYRAHLNLGLGYHFAGDPVLSERHLRRAAELGPHESEPYRLLGELYRYYDKTDAAIAAFTEALRRDPDDAKARDRLSELQKQRENDLIRPDNPDTLPPP